MSLFKDMLGSSESLFKNPVALDFDFVPKLIPYREGETTHIATCIKPLLNGMNGRNVLVYGSPGIGKTVATRHVLAELEEETDEVIAFYVNCWQHNTSYKIFLSLCDQLDYKFTQNKKTEELFDVVKKAVNKKACVFAFDEVDKIEDEGFLYSILEEVYKKCIILLTNRRDWLADLDTRIRSRLMPDLLEFKPYNAEETRGILKNRKELAFVSGVFEEEAFDIVVRKTAELGDLRTGLFLLKESGLAAEEAGSKIITKEHVALAVKKMDSFSIKKSTDLEDETRFILSIVKKNPGKKIGDIFRAYQDAGGKAVYKTFQRKIARLESSKFISVKKINGGTEGNTTMIYTTDNKKLTDF